MLLAVTTGATDATAFERLGHVFASVITGNLVLLGVSAVQAEGRLALFSGCALVGYGLGVLVCAPRSATGEGEDRLWPRAVNGGLLVDLVFLAVFALGWELADAHPSHAVQALLLGAVGAAMGAQSTAVRRFGQISTTYLTSTLTGLLEAVARLQMTAAQRRSLAILMAALAGAAGGTALVLHAARWLPVLQLGPVLIVILASRRLFDRPAPDAA